MLRKLGVGTLGAGVAGGTYVYFKAKKELGEDALSRQWQYNRVAFPVISEYKWTEAKCEILPKFLPSIFPPVTDEEERAIFEVLHRKHAKSMFDIFMKLGGFFYKNGQKVASNNGGVVPQYYIDMFQPFLNDIPARDPADVRAVMEAELGCKREQVFSSFDEKPIGCASIGQAHRATLKSTGERVVVKVQNPEAERTFKGDVYTLKWLVDAFAPQISPAFEEISLQFATEFDYQGECANAIEIRKNLAASPFKNLVRVPKMHEQLCTKKMMVMEEIYPSTPLHDALNDQAERMAKQQGITKDEFIKIETAKLEKLQLENAAGGKAVQGLSAETFDKYIKLQKAKRGVLGLWRKAFNYTIGLALPKALKYDLAADDVMIPLNTAKIVDDLLAIHGYECLINGCFNADPHPGNVLFLDGKLALIDYGQVKRLTDKERLMMSKTFVLLEAAMKVDPKTDPKVDPEVHQRAKASVAKSMYDMGLRTKDNKVDAHYEMATVYYGRMDLAWTYPRNLLQWTDHIQEVDPLKSLDHAKFFVMIINATMMLRGLGGMLMQDRNLATCWAPYARQNLKANGTLAEVEAEIKSWSKA